MERFKIVTDSTADLPKDYREKHDLGCMSLSCLIDDVVYGQELELEPTELFAAMRGGKMPTTSQINPEEAKAYFEEYYQTDKNILYLAFSSALSGTYESGVIAAEQMMSEHPDCKIIVIDTLCAALGEGLLVHKAVMMRGQGASMEEVAQWVKSNMLNVVHAVTVDDLHHLHRGGRVSKTSAVIGTLVGIKPLIYVDDSGRLIVMGKVRGRKKSLDALVDYMEQKTITYHTKNDTVFIAHGDCLEDAEYVRDQVKLRFGINECLIDFIGPIIGTHTGPGVVALFFMGSSR